MTRLISSVILLAVLFLLVLPIVAIAQDQVIPEIPSIFGLDGATIALYLAVGLAVIELAKRVVAIIPGKRDDEIVGVVDNLVRRLLDLVAGKNGKPSDPSLVKRE